jgi:hypothetical protein
LNNRKALDRQTILRQTYFEREEFSMAQVKKGLSQRVRRIAREKYIDPARRAGATTVWLRVRDLMEDVRKEGITPEGNTPQFCNAIQIPAFLEENHLEIEEVDGPPSKLSTTVVVKYRIIEENQSAGLMQRSDSGPETPEQRADRLIGKILGLMKDEIDARGGAEGFMQWVRSVDDEEQS